MLALLVWAAAQDVRTRRIRNWLTLSLAWGGLISSLFVAGGVTPMQSVGGLLVGFALPFVLFALGALGGGDVKLLAGVGAWVGPVNVMIVFAVAALVGMVIVLVQSIAQGRLVTLFRNSTVLLINLWHVQDVGTAHLSETGKACRSVERPLPYAVPVLAATVLVLATG
jgi:prepilin peptidase CpaA